MTDQLKFAREDGATIAYRQISGQGPGIVWLHGFRADMTGTKAQALAEWAGHQGRAFLRFDYSGHGASSGDFAEGTISRWRDDALAVLDSLTDGPQILVASSMGGWIATLIAKARPERVAGLVLIAPAPDLTEDLIWANMPEAVRQIVREKGQWLYENPYDAPYPITRALIEDGRSNLVLSSKIAVNGPVRILHGDADTDVPWSQGFKLLECFAGDVTFTVVKGADHRMSSPRELKLIIDTVDRLLKDIT